MWIFFGNIIGRQTARYANGLCSDLCLKSRKMPLPSLSHHSTSSASNGTIILHPPSAEHLNHFHLPFLGIIVRKSYNLGQTVGKKIFLLYMMLFGLGPKFWPILHPDNPQNLLSLSFFFYQNFLLLVKIF